MHPPLRARATAPANSSRADAGDAAGTAANAAPATSFSSLRPHVLFLIPLLLLLAAAICYWYLSVGAGAASLHALPTAVLSMVSSLVPAADPVCLEQPALVPSCRPERPGCERGEHILGLCFPEKSGPVVTIGSHSFTFDLPDLQPTYFVDPSSATKQRFTIEARYPFSFP